MRQHYGAAKGEDAQVLEREVAIIIAQMVSADKTVMEIARTVIKKIAEREKE
jgi:hypothetical protein